MAEGALRELIASFGVEVDHKELDAFENGLDHLVEKVKSVGERMLAFFAVHEIKEFFDASIEAGAQLDIMSDKLGVATDKLQEFQFMAATVGVEGETAAHSLMLLNRHVGEAVTKGGEAAAGFAKFGIRLKDESGNVRDVQDILEDTADAFQKIQSPQERAAAAMQMFGRQGQVLIPLLKNGKQGMEELRDEFHKLGGGMSQEFIKQARETHEEMLKVRTAFQFVKTAIVAGFLPYIKQGAELVKQFGLKLIDVVKHTNSIGHAIEALKAVGIVAFFWQIIQAVKVLAVEGLAAVAPWALWAAGILLVYLAFDDLRTMMEGGESLIGDFIESIAGAEGKEKYIESLKAAFDDLKGVLTDAGAALQTLWEAIKNITPDAILFVTKALGELIRVAAAGVVTVETLFNLFSKEKNQQPGGAGRVLYEGGQKIAKALGIDIGPNANRDYFGNLPPTAPESVSVPSFKREGPPVTVQQKNDVTIQVTGSNNGDVKAVGQAVGQGVTDALHREKISALTALKRM